MVTIDIACLSILKIDFNVAKSAFCNLVMLKKFFMMNKYNDLIGDERTLAENLTKYKRSLTE